MGGTSITRIALAGAAGRMGKAVLEVAAADRRLEIVAALTAPDASRHESVRTSAGDLVPSGTLDVPCDALIDFTVAEGTMAWLDVCRERKLPMVIGATGHSAEHLERIQKTAKVIPIVQTSNFSVGIQAILRALGQLVRDLKGYDVEIVETHHRNKIDAPSGTALTLANTIADALGRSVEDDAVFGRHGTTGVRPGTQIGIHSVRMGEIVGEHEIHLSGPGETVTIRHTAHSRATFAAGALRAAQWVVGRPPGLYTMKDVIGGSA